jgi:hypothetical protein
VIVADVDLVGSALLVAVSVAVVAAGSPAGARYVAVVIVDAVIEPTPLPRLQVTPALVESFATVAVKLCVALAANVDVVGVRLTLIGGTVTTMVIVTDADFVVSLLLVAVSVAVVVAASPVGATYVADVMDDVLIDPTLLPRLHVTPAPAESFATVAVNTCDPPLVSDAVAGVIVTLVGVDAPPEAFCPPQPISSTPRNAGIATTVHRIMKRLNLSSCCFGPGTLCPPMLSQRSYTCQGSHP